MPLITYVEKNFSPASLALIRTADTICRDYQQGFDLTLSSWELDALEPTMLDRLIEAEIHAWRDDALWSEATRAMERERDLLEAVSRRWTDVAALVAGES
ncbi:hypothetical protein [Streptomyces sp. NPDC058595]|uniref:hypothetical protein n=1 Tax=Streptomyces sp. NPDC058595 TaxID=3346550 RepID=UPI003664EBAE